MSGCVSTPEIVKVPTCDGFSLIIINSKDVLTRQTKEQILAHDEFYDAHCSNDKGGDPISADAQ